MAGTNRSDSTLRGLEMELVKEAVALLGQIADEAEPVDIIGGGAVEYVISAETYEEIFVLLKKIQDHS